MESEDAPPPSTQSDLVASLSNTGDSRQDGMAPANLNTEAAELVSSQAENDEGPLTQSDASRHQIDEDNDIDHEDILTEIGAATTIEPTDSVDIKYGDTYILPYEISYMCQDHMACGTTNTEETDKKTPYGDENTCTNSNNGISGQSIGYGASDIDADCVEDGQNTENVRHHPNILYPHVSCLQRGQVQNHIYTQNALNSISINTENPSPMYAQNALNSDPLNQPNVHNPSPMYAPNGNPERELPASDSATSTGTSAWDGTVTSAGAVTSPGTVTSSETVEKKIIEDPASDATALVATGGMAEGSHGQETETEETSSSQADIGDIKPYAVRYQTDDDVASTKINETRNRQMQDANCRNIDKIEPYAVRYRDDDDVLAEENVTEQDQMQDASCGNVGIEPYAVRYGEDDDLPTERNTTESEKTQDISTDNANIEPYAVAYMGQEEVTSEGRNDISAGCSSSGDATNASARQGCSNGVRDDRNQPHDPQQHICGCRYRWERDVILTTIALLFLIIGGSLIGVFFYTGTRDTQQTATFTPSHVSDHPGCCSSGTTTIPGPTFKVTTAKLKTFFEETAPTLLSNITRGPCDGNEKSERIIFGGLGTEPGKFKRARGVSVSGDNEIFVADYFNTRIQVHTMCGVYLRLFRTVLPGKKVKTMQPSDVAIDGEGHLWVVGRRRNGDAHVVQYSRGGQPLSKFDLTGEKVLPDADIAVDVSNHKVIVTIRDGMLVFQPNGSLHLRFQEGQKLVTSSVTTDNEGNILVTVKPNRIQVYNSHGRRLFTARVRGGRQGRSRGICLDSSGRIVVANALPGRVEMYTSRGDFVRTLANIAQPWGVAMGRDGQLVVTSLKGDTVTIFPRQVI